MAKAPAAIEAKDGDVGADAANAGEGVDDDVGDKASAAKYSDLMDFINGGVDGSTNDWIERSAMSWEGIWRAACEEATKWITEECKEDKVGEFAGKRIWNTKEVSEEERLLLRNIGVLGWKIPNNDCYDNWENNAPPLFDYDHVLNSI